MEHGQFGLATDKLPKESQCSCLEQRQSCTDVFMYYLVEWGAGSELESQEDKNRNVIMGRPTIYRGWRKPDSFDLLLSEKEKLICIEGHHRESFCGDSERQFSRKGWDGPEERQRPYSDAVMSKSVETVTSTVRFSIIHHPHELLHRACSSSQESTAQKSHTQSIPNRIITTPITVVEPSQPTFSAPHQPKHQYKMIWHARLMMGLRSSVPRGLVSVALSVDTPEGGGSSQKPREIC
jgi:hypothetical protein